MTIAALTAFCFSFIAIKVFKPLAIDLGLVDKPNARKHHDGQVPLIGGIAIFAAVLAASLIWLPNTLELRMYLIASAMMVFIGALDDKYDLKVRIRIVGQIIIASLMIFGVGGYISNLGNLFSFGDIELGPVGILFTYFAIIVVINAYNMVDGIDGLIGSLSLNTFTAIAVLFLISGNTSYLSYPLILATATLPYLIFNLGFFKSYSKKIFMGDAGSMFIGLSVIWLLTIGTQGESASFRPVTALWICAIPLMDMLAIVMRRYRKGKSPFKPDRDHLHHILQRAGLSSRQTLVVISIASALMSILGVLGEYFQVPESIELVLFVLMFILYNKYARHFSWKYDE
ncbi:UDP-N-acetylglucosamine--undecaprenyl-phosphate N-acetylglucosaminephosphotransferase [Colwellia sp. MB3u-70]|uniref:UDP-N-acetylglucosamine--undecaprenyl-phosphate N-acetylglucosaminephosphotransferase n=1 Tax=unclassified Colwellia TaxID=196834 RepID=UPI0015F6FDA1|nr:MULTISPECIES: UDP-N-acetylglucosamine--undecaprenyl-phosphate N-acetylglucosaminephosphotransferase [unclassified Colwellia]MBA6292578.1 UDP-N-acetylglucosamine--undecaprenyl-phosphate N-acetylglucosaminephosphotransferase [Colwellia sp. MB3u-8]MBA6307373.1 UDP-N-acetylglucosamine--undecaprenyl-phosphate N-acetylglucosaminephosphotransferase [Colwellia sp. MB3u-70]